MRRGEIWWASLAKPKGSEPGYRRPVLILQSDEFNRSLIQTVVVAAITSNVALAQAPGNVLIRPRESGLARDSVINVSQIVTIDKAALDERVGNVTTRTLEEVEEGVRLVLGF
jgi:mRNA interferase MazF